MVIIIVDYGMGNLRSVEKKVHQTGHSAIISNDITKIKNADRLILPGVGHFKNAVENLLSLNLMDILNEMVLIKKTPILGICLGMQLMASHSEEGDAEGFGWFDADVVRFKVADTLKYKIPHMGWNSLESKKESQLLKDLPAYSQYYFVHSYHFRCNDASDILTTTRYETEFVSTVQKGNIFGTQFHPEKSHEAGERMLGNFLGLGIGY